MHIVKGKARKGGKAHKKATKKNHLEAKQKAANAVIQNLLGQIKKMEVDFLVIESSSGNWYKATIDEMIKGAIKFKGCPFGKSVPEAVYYFWNYNILKHIRKT